LDGVNVDADIEGEGQCVLLVDDQQEHQVDVIIYK
jgi:hypothetical protein